MLIEGQAAESMALCAPMVDIGDATCTHLQTLRGVTESRRKVHRHDLDLKGATRQRIVRPPVHFFGGQVWTLADLLHKLNANKDESKPDND